MVKIKQGMAGSRCGKGRRNGTEFLKAISKKARSQMQLSEEIIKILELDTIQVQINKHKMTCIQVQLTGHQLSLLYSYCTLTNYVWCVNIVFGLQYLLVDVAGVNGDTTYKPYHHLHYLRETFTELGIIPPLKTNRPWYKIQEYIVREQQGE